MRGIKTEVLSELIEAGEPVEAVADDYSLELEDLKAAIAYEWQFAA